MGVKSYRYFIHIHHEKVGQKNAVFNQTNAS